MEILHCLPARPSAQTGMAEGPSMPVVPLVGKSASIEDAWLPNTRGRYEDRSIPFVIVNTCTETRSGRIAR